MEFSQKRPWWLLPPGQIAPLWWLVAVGPMLAIEYFTGSYQHLPVLYVIPVCLAAFYSGRWPAITLSVVTGAAHVAFTVTRTPQPDLFPLLTMSLIRAAVITFMALWFARLAAHERALQEEVEALKGLLPICAFCKSIRNAEGEWERLEHYVSRRSEAEFSHGICPPCAHTHYAESLSELSGSELSQVMVHVEIAPPQPLGR